jgi:TonB family protein
MSRMSPRLASIASCLWLAAGAAPAAPSAAAASPAAQSLQALWGARLLHAVVIADVAPGSPAEKAGLRIADVLESYDRIGIDDVAGFEEFGTGLKNAARKGPVAVKIRRFDFDAGPPRTLSLDLRLPDDAETRVGLAIHPAVFFLDMQASGAAAKAGIKPWDCIDGVEDETLSDRPRLNDFETHVLTLRNKDGNVRVTVGRWRPASAGTDPKIDLVGMREIALPVPAVASLGPLADTEIASVHTSISEGRWSTSRLRHPQLIHRERPAFPTEAARAGVRDATVYVQVQITPTGEVIPVEVVECTNPGLGFEEEAFRTVAAWHYSPAFADGKPVGVYLIVTVRFHRDAQASI